MNPYSVEPLSEAHQRADFASGVKALDSYFHHHVAQDMRRRLTACFVAIENSTGRVAGYYTLTTSSLPLAELDEALRRKLPRYPLLPAVRLGRLAVGTAHRGKGLGSALLLNALACAIRSEIAVYAMVVDAKDETAAAFYGRHGFMPFESVANTLYFPMAEAVRRLSAP